MSQHWVRPLTDPALERLSVCRILSWPAKRCNLNTKKVVAFEDYDTRPHTPVRFEVLCRREPEEMRICKIPKMLLGVSGGKAPSTEESIPTKQDVSRSQSRTMADEKWTASKDQRKRQTARKGTQAPENQRARDGTQAPKIKGRQGNEH